MIISGHGSLYLKKPDITIPGAWSLAYMFVGKGGGYTHKGAGAAIQPPNHFL